MYPNCEISRCTMESVMLCLLRGECVTLSEAVNNLDETVHSICESITSRWAGLLHGHHVETLDYGGDGALLEINILLSLFQADHCKRIKELQQRFIADSRLFDSLVHFLGEQNYLVGYSACKALVAFLIHDTTRSDKLKYLAQWCVDDDHSVSDEGKSRYHRILLTFDLFRFLCKKQHTTDRKPSCSCGEIQTSTWVDREDDMLTAMSSLIKLLDSFEFCFKKTQGRHDGYIESVLVNDDMKCLKRLSSKELDMLLLSFIKMVKAFIKGTCREPDPNLMLDIVKFLVMFVKEGLQISRQSLKTSFDILTMVLQLQVKDSTRETKELHMLQIQTAHSLCELINEEWLGKLPVSTTGPVGFGGVNFIETCPQQRGDLTLLRRLTKLTFISVHLITKQAATEEDVSYLICSACTLRHLKTFTASLKLDVSSDTDADWITQLFADEDEMMVSALFHALQIYKETVTTPTGSYRDSSAVPARCEFQQLLCPHRLFFAYLKLLDFDHSVLLDLLISCETNFLEYFTSYLHLMKREWNKCCEILIIISEEKEFSEEGAETDSEDSEIPLKKMKKINNSLGDIFSVNSEDGSILAPAGDQLSDDRFCLDDGEECNNLLKETMSNPRTAGCTNSESIVANHALDQVMSAFIRLRMSLERLEKRNVFPYAISPLLRLLQDLEDLYECQ